MSERKFKVGDKVRVSLEAEVVRLEQGVGTCYEIQIRSKMGTTFLAYDDEMEKVPE